MKDELCLFCNKESETTADVLWQYCPAATDVWGASELTFQKSTNMAVDFAEIFEYMLHRCSRDELDLFAIIARSIWKRRNVVVHGGVFQRPWKRRRAQA
jgi:hypothetical protein